MGNNTELAKHLCLNKWEKLLPELQRKPKCRDYGRGANIDSLWNTLPKTSKEYWLNKVAYHEANPRYRNDKAEESNNG